MEFLPLGNKLPQKKIIIFTHSGLNNRLLPLISGFRAAEILNRQLLIYWSDTPRRTGMKYQSNSGLRFHDLFENPIDEVSIDEINNFTVDFNEYLISPETILSFTIDSSDGIKIISSSESGGIVTMQCKGLKEKLQVVKIVITTSTGRVNPETINFSVTLI